MTHSRRGITCAVVLFWALSCVLASEASAAELIVRRDAGLSAGQRADLREDAGVTHARTLALDDAEVVTVPDADADAALAKLKADPDVVYAVPNVKVHLASTTVPPLTRDNYAYLQWSLENPATDADIDLASAWSLGERPGDGVDVAVVDQAIHTTHQDLTGQLDSADAKSFVQNTTCTASQPLVDHGTHIAGTIAARRDNTWGIAGIAPYARIVPVQAFDNCGDGDLDAILEAFTYAAGKAGIVTGSFATDPLDAEAVAVNDAFTNLLGEFPDTLFVVAAGNEGSDNGEFPVYPCDAKLFGRFEPANLLCVSMSNDQDAPDCQSNVGGSADIFAPGRDIVASSGTFRGAEALTGTSQAAAVVAGIAALGQWFEPGWTGEQLKDTLTVHVDHVPGMEDLVTSGGRVNAARALLQTKDTNGRDLGPGGPGGTWSSCDVDHDGFSTTKDDCPADAGTLKGCPDADHDAIRDDRDNCRSVANADQKDMDGDGIGDACDKDRDGDFKEADDVCPSEYALTPNGCLNYVEDPIITDPPPPDPIDTTPIIVPVPTPTAAPPPIVQPVPMRVTIAVKVTHKVAKVTVKPTRATTLSVRVERLVRKQWRKVTVRSLASGTAGRSLTLRRLVKGKYRVTATAAGVKQAKNFKV